jgi:hypothetical protein
MDVLTNFLAILAVGLLVLAIPIVVAGAFQFWRTKSTEIKQKLGKDRLDAVEKAVHLAVRAAEQVGLSDRLKTGREKFDYAVSAVQRHLDQAGIPIEVDEIATLIESEVNKNFSNYAPPIDTPETRSALIDKAIETAVMAAEQSGAKKMAVELGAQVALSKKDYATDFAKNYLLEHGITIDPNLVDGLIEGQIMKFKLKALEWKATGAQNQPAAPTTPTE